MWKTLHHLVRTHREPRQLSQNESGERTTSAMLLCQFLAGARGHNSHPFSVGMTSPSRTCQPSLLTARPVSTAPPRLMSTAQGGCVMSAMSLSDCQTPGTASRHSTPLMMVPSNHHQHLPCLPRCFSTSHKPLMGLHLYLLYLHVFLYTFCNKN